MVKAVIKKDFNKQFKVLPFPRSYWIVPGLLLAGNVPVHKNRKKGLKRLAGLFAVGIRSIVNLQQAHETDFENMPFPDYTKDFCNIEPANKEMNCVRFPIKDLGVPDKKLMRRILIHIDHSIEMNLPVYIHCWGGKGRTGTVAGCYLIKHGMANRSNVLEMIEYLRRTDPRAQYSSPETPEQIAMVLNWKKNM